MKNLTDIEICKKIAEIEGVGNEWLAIPGRHNRDAYNPLTDKALLWDLMVKYNIEIDYNIHVGMSNADVFLEDLDEDKSRLPRAVLLEIIEVHQRICKLKELDNG